MPYACAAQYCRCGARVRIMSTIARPDEGGQFTPDGADIAVLPRRRKGVPEPCVTLVRPDCVHVPAIPEDKGNDTTKRSDCIHKHSDGYRCYVNESRAFRARFSAQRRLPPHRRRFAQKAQAQLDDCAAVACAGAAEALWRGQSGRACRAARKRADDGQSPRRTPRDFRAGRAGSPSDGPPCEAGPAELQSRGPSSTTSSPSRTRSTKKRLRDCRTSSVWL